MPPESAQQPTPFLEVAMLDDLLL
ncbi:MAG: hypothetical protein QOI38_3053, partial [Sphingomonadales bacterium]|nr:hypothetical protein [Sphingomonadales bacterium]